MLSTLMRLIIKKMDTFLALKIENYEKQYGKYIYNFSRLIKDSLKTKKESKRFLSTFGIYSNYKMLL